MKYFEWQIYDTKFELISFNRKEQHSVFINMSFMLFEYKIKVQQNSDIVHFSGYKVYSHEICHFNRSTHALNGLDVKNTIQTLVRFEPNIQLINFRYAIELATQLQKTAKFLFDGPFLVFSKNITKNVQFPTQSSLQLLAHFYLFK